MIKNWADQTQTYGRIICWRASSRPMTRLNSHMNMAGVWTKIDSGVNLKCRMFFFFTECECSDTRTRFNDTAAPQLPCRKTTLVQFAPVLSESNSTATRCISAYPLMTTKTQDCPCRIQGQICVKPKREEQILRIQWSDASAIQRGDSNHERVVVLWSGEKRDIWASVQVSSWMPRFGLVGKTTIGAFEVIFE